MGLETVCLVLVLAVFAAEDVSSLSYTVQDCPAHVPHDTNVRVYGNNCYYFMMNSQHDYATAKQSCNYLGGFLTTVEDINTQHFLYHVISQEYNSGFTVWIGLRNSGQNGTYMWENGVEATYFNWAPNMVTKVIQDNGCAAMDTDHGGVWKVFPCHYEMFVDTVLPFVCQIPITSECQVCGDINSDVPCSHLDMTFAPYVKCDTLSPYCMNDVIKTSGIQRVFKRCVNESTCRQKWWEQTSKDPDCAPHLSTTENDLQCHFCCHGNDCNRGLVPDQKSLFKPETYTTTRHHRITHLPPRRTQAPTTPAPVANTTKPSTPAPPTTPPPVMRTIPTTVRVTHPTTTRTTTRKTTRTTHKRATHPTNKHATHAATHKPTTPAATPIGSQCVVCGNRSSDRPCSPLDLVMASSVTCPDSTPYCMNDLSLTIVNGATVTKQYKRCVNQTECRKLWFEGTSDKTTCMRYDANRETNDALDCHYCCYGDMCNLNDLPPLSSLYHP